MCFPFPSLIFSQNQLELKHLNSLHYNQQPMDNSLKEFITEFVVSGTAAAISKTIASPIEVIKIRLQLQAPLIEKKLIDKPYLGIVDCFKRLYVQQGWKAYYKGNFTNTIRYFPTQALNFAFKDLYMKIFKFNKSEKQSFLQTVKNNMIGGSLAGASTQFFVYPLDYTRTRLTNDIQLAKIGRPRQFEGIVDCMKKTYGWDGSRGLYRGFVVTCIFMMVYRGIYFGLNAGFKQEIPHQYLKNVFISFCVSYGVTVTSGIVAYPLDTVRRRMMMSSGQSLKFTSSLQCIKHLYNENKWRAFYGGVGANVLRGITGAGVLTIYDMLQLVLFGKKYKTSES